MMAVAREVKLEPGWLEKQFADIAALRAAQAKIDTAATKARINGYTQPTTLEFTIPELRALAYMNRFL